MQRVSMMSGAVAVAAAVCGSAHATDESRWSAGVDVGILSADAVHLQGNRANRRIPYFPRQTGEQKPQFLTSTQRIADLMAFHSAQLWIVHDTLQTNSHVRSPGYFE